MSKYVDIHCPGCGAPAHYDIAHQNYLCEYCGSRVKVADAHKERRGFRQMQAERLQNSIDQYELESAQCTGCGATVVFQKGEALGNCAFCGRSLVRKAFRDSSEIPELVVPFRITLEEAQARLLDWCDANKEKKEAKLLREQVGGLQGFYLPYELVKGPVSCRAHRVDRGMSQKCIGYADEIFVNRSEQLDNLLLDAMEPFELDELLEFDFAYVAGHQVKTGDIPEDRMVWRVKDEITTSYEAAVADTFNSEAVSVYITDSDLLRMPALMPVYYFRSDDQNLMCAINGQTGKVSVKALKEITHVFMPWWLKAIVSTLGITGLVFCFMMALGASMETGLGVASMLLIFNAIVCFASFGESMEDKWFKVDKRRQYFSSKGGAWRRQDDGSLAQDAQPLERHVNEPVFVKELGGVEKPVELEFATFKRVVLMALLALVIIFLPVILALFVNGFNFSQLELGGSAVWLCVAVPTVPIIMVKNCVEELYDNPWIYVLNPDGTKKRFRAKDNSPKEPKERKEVVKGVLKFSFTPPGCLLVWGVLAIMGIMVYLTAFGF